MATHPDLSLPREPGVVYDCDRLQAILPHRYPLLMLDRLLLFPAGRQAVGLKNVTINEPHFQGHFPGNPVLPGVLMLEAILQTGAACIRQVLGVSRDMAFLLALRDVKFRKPVVPGQRLMTRVSITRERRGVVHFTGTASVNDAQACQASFSLGLTPALPKPVTPEEFAPALALKQVPLGAVPIEDVNGVMAIIPHRYPFMLVDAIYHKGEGRVIGLKNVTGNEPFFNGHFRQFPVMPGTLLIEAMAQVGAAFILSKPDYEGKIGMLMSVESARFRRPVRPGDQLLIDVCHTVARPRVGKARGVIYIGPHPAAAASISFVIVDRTDPT